MESTAWAAAARPIRIRGAREGNLQGVDVDIPRGRLVALTGVSGSGKSTLAVDLLFQECQRQYLEAMGMQGIRRPAVDRVTGASPALCILQGAYGKSARSTAGTVTGVNADLRMLFEKLHRRACPHCGAMIDADACRETTQGHGDDFRAFMDCPVCGARMDKLTRADFSFNTRAGACPECRGLGVALRLCEERVLHEDRTLEDGAVDYWRHRYGAFEREAYFHALRCVGLPVPEGLPLRDFTPEQRALLLEGTDTLGSGAPKTAAEGRFEGVLAVLRRRLDAQGPQGAAARDYFAQGTCPACGGERLAPLPRGVTVEGVRLPQLHAMQLDALDAWLTGLEARLSAARRALVAPYLADLHAKIARIARLGLGYLTPARATDTLSGGEAQRLRLCAALDTGMTGLLVVLDEPTVGLHPRDTLGLIALLRGLAQEGNTVLVIEHDLDVIRAADHVIDLGPGSGRMGGRVVAQGAPQEIAACPGSATGAWLRGEPALREAARRTPSGFIRVRDARLHNLQGVDVSFPTGCLTAVTGVSGSGKTSLVMGVLAHPEGRHVEGLEAFTRIVTSDAAQVVRMRRSNAATFTGLYDALRKRFAALESARALSLTPGHFSFNVKGGRCERCEGMGTVTSSMLFFPDAQVTCPECHGRRFCEAVLSVRLDGRSIADVLDLDVDAAAQAFAGDAALARPLNLLREAGLGYLTLGQALPTLSGGEAQRLGLVRDLLQPASGPCLYLLDEPTTGLHPQDVAHFLRLLRRLTDAGHTVIVVEHNLQLIAACDYAVDLGPEGGAQGGRVVACGAPEDLCACEGSHTGRALRAFLSRGGAPFEG